MTRQEEISAAIKRVLDADTAVIQAQLALDTAVLDSAATQQKLDTAQSVVLGIGNDLLQKGIVQNNALRAVGMAQGQRSNAIEDLKTLENSSQTVMT